MCVMACVVCVCDGVCVCVMVLCAYGVCDGVWYVCMMVYVCV